MVRNFPNGNFSNTQCAFSTTTFRPDGDTVTRNADVACSANKLEVPSHMNRQYGGILERNIKRKLVSEPAHAAQYVRVSRRKPRAWKRRNSKHLLRLTRYRFYARKICRRMGTNAPVEDGISWSEMCNIRKCRINAHAEGILPEVSREIISSATSVLGPACSTETDPCNGKLTPSEWMGPLHVDRLVQLYLAKSRATEIKSEISMCPTEMESSSVWRNNCFVGFKNVRASSKKLFADIKESLEGEDRTYPPHSSLFHKSSGAPMETIREETIQTDTGARRWVNIPDEEYSSRLARQIEFLECSPLQSKISWADISEKDPDCTSSSVNVIESESTSSSVNVQSERTSSSEECSTQDKSLAEFDCSLLQADESEFATTPLTHIDETSLCLELDGEDPFLDSDECGETIYAESQPLEPDQSLGDEYECLCLDYDEYLGLDSAEAPLEPDQSLGDDPVCLDSAETLVWDLATRSSFRSRDVDNVRQPLSVAKTKILKSAQKMNMRADPASPSQSSSLSRPKTLRLDNCENEAPLFKHAKYSTLRVPSDGQDDHSSQSSRFRKDEPFGCPKQTMFHKLVAKFDYARAKKYCHTLLTNSSSAKVEEELHFTDELLAGYIVDCIVGRVGNAVYDAVETSDPVTLADNQDQAYSQGGEWDSLEIFNSWTSVLDDVYETTYATFLPVADDEELVVSEPHPCIAKFLGVGAFVASLIQFVVLLGSPHCDQSKEDSQRRSEVALDLLVCPEHVSAVFSHHFLCPVKEILFQCFSAFEIKPPAQFPNTAHVTGLISYINAVYPDEVRKFLMEHQSAAYMLAYYIYLPGVVDLNLRLILHNSELRPVRSVGIVRDDNFLQYLMTIQWFHYLSFHMLDDKRVVEESEKELASGAAHPRVSSILQFLTRLFEICEMYFRPATRDQQTAEYLFALLRYVIVDHNLVGHILEFAVTHKGSVMGMDAMQVILSLMRLVPFSDYVGRQIGAVLYQIFPTDLSECDTVPSPSRARSVYRRLQETSLCDQHVGPFECARLKAINFYMEVTRTMDKVPSSLWPVLMRWYLDPEKRNHICHAILFSIWKHFIKLAPESLLDEFLPEIIESSMTTVFHDNFKFWCDLKTLDRTDCSHVSHHVEFTKHRRHKHTLGTSLHLILFVAEVMANKSRALKIGLMPDIRRILCSSRFQMCYRGGRDRQFTTLNYAGSAHELKQKPLQSPRKRRPAEFPFEFISRNGPPSVSPPNPPRPLLLTTLDPAPAQLIETRKYSREDMMWVDSFTSGLISFADCASEEKRCEKEREDTVLL